MSRSARTSVIRSRRCDRLPSCWAAGRESSWSRARPSTAPARSGRPDQPDFANAVARVETTLGADELLDALLAVEAEFGRVRDVRWGPRTLDLDLIWYQGEERSDARLMLPHPRAHEREFVLRPLADLDPGLVLRGGRVADWLAGLDPQGVEPTGAALM